MTDSAYVYINLDYLNLMIDGDNDMKKVMLEMLFDELPTEIEKMNMHAANHNWQELKAVSHKMKSTLAFVGNDVLTVSNQEIEQIAKSESRTERVPALLEKIGVLAPKVLAELRKEHSRL